MQQYRPTRPEKGFQVADETMSKKRKRHTPQQIVEKLRDAEVLLGQGQTIAEVSARFGVSEVTFHRWRNQFGGMKSDAMKRLKELEAENGRLKRAVADLTLDNQMLKEVAKGEF